MVNVRVSLKLKGSWKFIEKMALQSRFLEFSNEEIERLLKNPYQQKQRKQQILAWYTPQGF